MKKTIFILLLFFCSAFCNDLENIDKPKLEEIKTNFFIDLTNPYYEDGTITTSKGGVIKGKNFRLQAKNIEYTNKDSTHTVKASGELILQYNSKVFTGEELEYDFEKNVGVITKGRTFAHPWYVESERIDLNSDGSFTTSEVSLTTCENINSSWELFVKKLNVSNESYLKAKHVTFKLLKFPIFYLPFYNMNLAKFTQTPMIDYQLGWDKGVGPKISLRYQVFSWKDFSLFLRGDYRFSRGFGGAVETTYLPTTYNSSFLTKNYLATDILPNDPKRKRRFRLQGAYNFVSNDNNSKINLTWDRYSDIHMPSDFRSPDFEINTALQTKLFVFHREKEFLTNIYVHPRINPFESFKQDLPTVLLSIRPLVIPYLNIISNNFSKLSYVDFVYAKNLSSPLNDMHSFRLESHHDFFRPINLSAINITPKVGAIGILYSNRPGGGSCGLGILSYGGTIETNLSRTYESYKHIIKPYLNFDGYSKPTTSVDSHFIFSIEDGYDRLNQLTLGLNNYLYPNDKKIILPTIEVDLFTNSFFGKRSMSSTFPHLYFNLLSNISFLRFSAKNRWNIHKNTLDFTHLLLGWTANENLAMDIEYHYRSKYYWRKADQTNFILDVTRQEGEMLLSPLSEKNNTVLTNIFLRINPFWVCHVQSHHGWSQGDLTTYNEYKIQLSTLIYSSWRLHIIYQHTQTDDRINFSLSLVKKHREIPLF